MPPMGELTDGFPSGFDGTGKLENPFAMVLIVLKLENFMVLMALR